MARPLVSLVALLFISTLTHQIYADHGMCTSPPPEDDPEASCGGDSSSHAPPSEPPPAPDQAEAEEEVMTEYPEPLSFIHDITATIDHNLPIWDSPHGFNAPKSKYSTKLTMDMRKGDPCFLSKVNMQVHTGTHIDMPSHFLESDFEAGVFADQVDLDVLVGPVLVLEVPSIFPVPGGGLVEVGNITAMILQDMLLIGKQKGLTRLILKTDSSRKDMMQNPKFNSSYTALTLDAARWITANTNITLIGIDYLSIATYEPHLVETHQELFSKGITVVEGLQLKDIQEGWYSLICLPLKLAGVEGAPARCVLTAAPASFWKDEQVRRQAELEAQAAEGYDPENMGFNGMPFGAEHEEEDEYDDI